MKQIDVRFTNEEVNLMKNMIGSTLTKYKCDPFEFSTAVYGIVGVCTNTAAYAFTNLIKVMDYYGANEDVAIFRVEQRTDSEIHSFISSNTMIEMPVNKTIKEIDIVNEHQQLYKDDVQTYDVFLTRGVIIRLEDNTEIALEKNVWFSEMITVDKGEQLLENFAPVEEFADNWEDDYHGVCSRDILRLN